MPVSFDRKILLLKSFSYYFRGFDEFFFVEMSADNLYTAWGPFYCVCTICPIGMMSEYWKRTNKDNGL